MGPALHKLLELGGAPFVAKHPDAAIESFDNIGDVGASIRDVLKQKNGFFCFEQALRFFPSRTVEASWGLADWNSPGLWKADYRGLADHVFCFAEEIFGRQFVACDGRIAIFEPETGDLEIVAASLEEWAAKMLLDYRRMTRWIFAHDWQRLHGRLASRHRLLAKTPFVLGGEYAIANLAELDSVRVMKALGNLAHQIHDLPNGSKIRFVIL